MNNILPFLPLGLIVSFAILIMLLEVFIKDKKEIVGYTSLVGLGLASLSTISLWKSERGTFSFSYFSDKLIIDNYSLFFYMLFFACGAVCIITSIPYLTRDNNHHSEFYALVLFAISGMMLMASGGDLMTLFLGLEIMSISIYVLVGFKRYDIKSNEATLKYFFLGAFSAGFILYGIALIYGGTGSTTLTEINKVISSVANAADQETYKYKNVLSTIGMLFILIGVMFKIAAVPFHNWAPDIYEGAPAPVTGFMITAVKAASFALFLKIFLVALIDLKDIWVEIIQVVAVITMFAGNILALTQNNIKRMLAYSSISHTGYLLIGIASLSTYSSNNSANAILYYLVSYSVSSLGLFACISYLSNKNEEYVDIEDYSGLGFKYPLIGITMSIFMLSLIGVPPTAGFFGKYYLFSSAMSQGMYTLVFIALLNSMLSIYYYLRVIAVMYLKEAKDYVASEYGKISTGFVLVYTSIATIWLGIGTATIFSSIPSVQTLIEWSKLSIKSLI